MATPYDRPTNRDLGSEYQSGITDMFGGIKDWWLESGMGLLNPNNPAYQAMKYAEDWEQNNPNMPPGLLLDDPAYMSLMEQGSSQMIDPSGIGGFAGALKAIRPIRQNQLNVMGLLDKPGGRYMTMDFQKTGPPKLGKDITGDTFQGMTIDTRGGKKSMTVDDEKQVPSILGESPKDFGGQVKVNLMESKKAGWHWDGDPPDSTNVVVSVEGKNSKHFFGLKAEYDTPVTMTTYPKSKSEPRLRPTTRGDVDISQSKVIGHIIQGGKRKPVLDVIKIKPKGVDAKTAAKASTKVPTALEVLEARAKQMELPKPKRLQPKDEPLFDLSPESYERTPSLLEQKRLDAPRLLPGETFPLGERMKPIEENMDELAEIIASKSRPALGTETQYFYNMSPVYEGLLKRGYSRDEVLSFLKEFGEGYGATSPRTSTDENLLNALLLRSKEGRGVGLSSIEGVGSGGISEKGYAMMDMHRNLYRDFVDEVNRMETAPKPTHFMSGAQGNLLSVTADTHAIRGALVALNELNPGSIPKAWFKPGGFEDYVKDPIGFMSNPKNMGKINDSLATKARNKVKSQVEYGTMHDLYEKVGEKLGVNPSEAQSLAWFSSGANTNLGSSPKSIPRLIDERIDVTAQALGKSKEEILDLVVRNKLPLLGAAPVGLFAPGLLSQEESP